MNPDAPKRPPLIVSPAEVGKVVPGTEAARDRLNEEEVEGSPQQRDTFLAAVGRGLGELQEAGRETPDSDVLVTAQHPLASLLQSRLAEVAAEQGSFEDAGPGGAEVRFDTRDLRWAQVVWDKLFAQKEPQRRPQGDGVEALPDQARLAIMADWGTGLYGAPKVAESIQNDPGSLDVVMHLGDVYYSGTEGEIEDRFLALWPQRTDAKSRALNSNHEMYVLGRGYFRKTLPAVHQESSYFALQNEHWTLLGLDSGYVDHALDDEQEAWVRRTIAAAGDRKVVLFSHHQLFSVFESQGPKLTMALADLLRDGRIHAWYWGHEHRCMIYDKADFAGNLLGRCLGHGGMPYSRKGLDGFPVESKVGDSLWRRAEATGKAPEALILDGPNPHITGKEDRYLPNGYMTLELDGEHLTEVVHTADGDEILRQDIA